MIGETQAQMRTITGEILPLQSVSAKGRLQGLVFELEVEQTYRNTEAEAIEVVYTFPVPARATLMGLEVTIGEKVLRGVAVRRQKASEDYEAAIEKGNTAVLLEQSEDGIFTVSLGNLPGGTDAKITYKYAELVDSFRDCVRLRVPTVIAPWYGDPARAGVQPHQTWQNDPAVDYPFSIEIDVLGELARCEIDAPGHAIDISPADHGRRVRTIGNASLDRDFVVNIRGEITRQQAVLCPDGDGWIAMASMVVPRIHQDPRSLALKILVDCSGSMGGASISQARRALTVAAERFYPGDSVSLTRFGSRYEHLTPGMRRASEDEIERLRRLVSGLQADLGGTEMADAVAATVQIPIEGAVKDILLITDGQIFDIQDVIARAEKSDHRLFVVSVGSAPVETLGRRLAERTGGSWESVAPGEDATGAVVRMFKRLREPARQLVEVKWPAQPIWDTTSERTLYGDDTLHVFARFDAPIAGNVSVRLVDGDAEASSITARMDPKAATAIAIPRIAVHAHLKNLSEEQAAEMAEHYQLAGRYTSYLLVDVHSGENQMASLPQLRKVAPMLPAGWSGTACSLNFIDLTFNQKGYYSAPSKPRHPLGARKAARDKRQMARLIVNRQAGTGAGLDRTRSPKEVLATIAASPQSFRTSDSLRAAGVPISQLIAIEEAAATSGTPIRRVIAVWIAVLVDILNADFLSPNQKLGCQRDYLSRRALRRARKACRDALAGVERETWPDIKW